jgi:type VI secretion system secreted protein VgrG
MSLPVTLTFPAAPSPLPAFEIDAWSLEDGLSRLFELTLRALVPDPALPLDRLVGHAIDVTFADQPFLPLVRGLVARARQLSAEPTGMSRYELLVVPRLWLATRRRGYAIFQGLASPELADAVHASIGLPPAVRRFFAAPPPAREFATLYEETAYDFLLRTLADDGVAFVVDHSAGGAVALMDDTAGVPAVRAESLPWSPGNLASSGPAVLGWESRAALSIGITRLRDYDAEHPLLALESAFQTAPLFTDEGMGQWHEWTEGVFRTPEQGDYRARCGTEERRAEHAGATAELSHALPPGSCLTLSGHPSADGDHYVTALRAEVEEVSPLQVSQRFVVDTLPAHLSFRPPQRPRPRVSGAQTAVVVSRAGKAIDVDALGRIEVALRWDFRGALEGGGTSRRVRFAQPWGGAVRGFVAFPRAGDEVVLTFLDGDPDRPLVVGSVHNPTQPVPQLLPGEETVSTWRSASSPEGGGYNEVKMDDASGAEKLELRAERDYRLVVGRDSETVVTGNVTRTVVGQAGSHVAGPYSVEAAEIRLKAAGALGVQGSGVTVQAGSVVYVVAPTITFETGGGAKLTLAGGEITMQGQVVTIIGEPIHLNP